MINRLNLNTSSEFFPDHRLPHASYTTNFEKLYGSSGNGGLGGQDFVTINTLAKMIDPDFVSKNDLNNLWAGTDMMTTAGSLYDMYYQRLSEVDITKALEESTKKLEDKFLEEKNNEVKEFDKLVDKFDGLLENL